MKRPSVYLEKLEDFTEDYHLLLNMSAYMEYQMYPPILFYDKVSSKKFSMQLCFCAKNKYVLLPFFMIIWLNSTKVGFLITYHLTMEAYILTIDVIGINNCI